MQIKQALPAQFLAAEQLIQTQQTAACSTAHLPLRAVDQFLMSTTSKRNQLDQQAIQQLQKPRVFLQVQTSAVVMSQPLMDFTLT